MQEFLDIIRQHWGIILAIAGLLASAFWLKMDSRYAKKTDLSEIRHQIESNQNKTQSELYRLRHDIEAVQNSLSNLPTAKDIHELHIATTKTEGECRLLRADIKSIRHIANLLIEKEVGGND